MIALDSGDTGWTKEDGPKEELAARVKELLLEKADMMNEYFSIVIDKVGNLRSLPVLLGKYNLMSHWCYVLILKRFNCISKATTETHFR